MAVRVKICGITRIDDAHAAIDAGADFIGLNFHPPSPRYLALDRAHLVRDEIDARALVVGVFVNADRASIEEYRRVLALDLLQFSGDAAPAMLTGWPIPVIVTRRLKVGDTSPAAPLDSDYILLDAYDSKLYGGTGMRIALDSLRVLDLSRAFVAGGLTPDNVAEVAALSPYAVDCASGVESSPGVKDHDKLVRFVANAKRAR